LSRKQHGSANRVKARRRVARVHEQTANRRKDFLHKLTTGLVARYDTIIIEDLNVKGLARTKLGKSFHDAAHAEIRRQLAYKAAWAGKNLVVIDRWYPSSKTCGSCGTINQELTLSDRAWACPCGTVHDRDLNAARNIRAEGLRQSSSIVAVGNTETLNACGGRVRRPTGATAATRHPAEEARTPQL